MITKDAIKDFLNRNGMLADNIDFLSETKEFVKEMKKGLEPLGTSSLKMLPTWLSTDDLPSCYEPVVVIDAGGTNIRAALATFENGDVKISHLKTQSMPGVNEEINADQLFDQMAEFVKPLMNKSNKLGFCFSYPVEMHSNRDGKLLRLTKELKVKDCSGIFVGERLLHALNEKNKKITVLNDTVAALLSGIAANQSQNRIFESYIGFVLGTGVNAAYIEKNSNVIKEPALRKEEGSIIINMESGNYSRIKGGNFDKMLDETSADPGKQGFEKMVSGAYLGELFHVTLKSAQQEGLLSGCAEQIKSPLDTKALNDFLLYPFGDNILAKTFNTNQDKSSAFFLIEELFERAAKLSAIKIAAITKKIQVTQNHLKPLCVIMEGSTYHKSKLIPNRIGYYVKKYMNDEMQVYADLIGTEYATLKGAAIAGIME